MSIQITLTDQIRNRYPGGYFSGFSETSVSIPDKPFVRELIEGKLDPKLLSIEQLSQCIPTCTYFGFPSTSFVEEFFWKIAEKKEVFEQWLVQDSKNEDAKKSSEISYSVRPDIDSVLRIELVSTWGQSLSRPSLIRMGARFFQFNCKQVISCNSLKLLRWIREESKTEEAELSYTPKQEKRLTAEACSVGSLEILKYLHTTSKNESPWDANTCTQAAKKGHLECLRYAHANGCELNVNYSSQEAFDGGTESHFECFKYILENEKVVHKKPLTFRFSCKDTKQSPIHFKFLEYASKKELYDSESYCSAAAQGHLECLKYLYELDNNPDLIYGSAATFAAEGGHLECLKFIVKIGAEIGNHGDESPVGVAAVGGHIECLKYLIENVYEDNFEDEITQDTLYDVASNGHLECLAFIYTLLGDPKSWSNCKWDEKICSYAASNGHLKVLQYAHENDCPWDGKTCANAAEGGHLEVLQYARENGCPWDEKTCSNAAKGGHLKILQYAHAGLFNEQTPLACRSLQDVSPEGRRLEGGGCPWDANTCANAAKGRHLACLQYAHENGCPWNEETCIAAAKTSFECFKYAYDNECPSGEKTLEAAKRSRDKQCLEYILKDDRASKRHKSK